MEDIKKNSEMKEKPVRNDQNKTKLVQLPLTRVKTIMKISNGVQYVSQDATYLTTKATELFIQYLSLQSKTPSDKKLDYKNLANTVQKDKSLEFLKQYFPQKITFKKFKEIMTEKEKSQELVTQDSDLSDDCVFDYSSQESSDSITITNSNTATLEE